MAREPELKLLRVTTSRVTRCKFYCPACGPLEFEITLESPPTARKVKFATDLVIKAHQLEHK